MDDIDDLPLFQPTPLQRRLIVRSPVWLAPDSPAACLSLQKSKGRDDARPVSKKSVITLLQCDALGIVDLATLIPNLGNESRVTLITGSLPYAGREPMAIYGYEPLRTT